MFEGVHFTGAGSDGCRICPDKDVCEYCCKMIMSLISSLLHAEFEKFVDVGVSYNHLHQFLKQIKVTTECNLVCVFKA